MSTKENLFEGFIKLTDRYYVKPCETAVGRFDLYEFKDYKSERHPEGKMDDVAFGASLEKAIEMAARNEASEVAKDLREMIEKLKKINKEILKNIAEVIS